MRPTAGGGSAALPLDQSGPPAAQSEAQQAMPAAASLQEQVQAARAAQHLAGELQLASTTKVLVQRAQHTTAVCSAG